MRVKRAQKKRYRRTESGFSRYNHEITGIMLFAFGVLVALSMYYKDSVGVFGSFIRSLLMGLLGLPAYLIPPVILLYAVVVIFKRDDETFRLRILYTMILLILISSLIHTGYYNEKEYKNLPPLDSVIKFFEKGVEGDGGGVFGGLLSAPFLKIFQILGTIIILTTLSFIDIILLTNISIANFIRRLKTAFLVVISKVIGVFKRRRVYDDMETDDLDKSNVIDFRAQKNFKAPKGKSEKTNDKSAAGEGQNVEPIKFIMKDFREQDDTAKKEINEEPVVQEKGNSKAPKTAVSETVIEKEISAHSMGQTTDYKYPPIDLLSKNSEGVQDINSLKNSALEGARKLEETLSSFNVEAKVVNVSRGPAVTRYELQPSPGVKVSKIVNLADDISLNLAASGVRIEAPIPGKAAVGIEVPNKEVTPVFLREVIESGEFNKASSKLSFAVGKDISGENIVADIAKMPHMLIAGATGAGKSVCINSLIISLLYKSTPEEVKLLMVDPKVVELGVYNGIPHLLIPVVTDPRKAAGALNWAVQEMVNRYKLFAEKGVRDIKGYNAVVKGEGEQGTLPQIVIIIDELADLMMVAPNDVEDAICRLAQMARAAGMHLVIATQRPSVDVITGIIKANIPSRISFAVTSQVDSRTILDMAGAEKLLGKGDMLFYPVGEPKPIRIKGAFVTEKEVESVVEYIKSLGQVEYDDSIIDEINSESGPVEKEPGDNDELLPQAIELVVESGQASVSLIQRKFKVGYARAARIVDQMEERGIVGGYEGSKPRQVLMTKLQLQEMQMNVKAE